MQENHTNVSCYQNAFVGWILSLRILQSFVSHRNLKRTINAIAVANKSRGWGKHTRICLGSKVRGVPWNIILLFGLARVSFQPRNQMQTHFLLPTPSPVGLNLPLSPPGTPTLAHASLVLIAFNWDYDRLYSPVSYHSKKGVIFREREREMGGRL